MPDAANGTEVFDADFKLDTAATSHFFSAESLGQALMKMSRLSVLRTVDRRSECGGYTAPKKGCSIEDVGNGTDCWLQTFFVYRATDIVVAVAIIRRQKHRSL